MTGRKSFDWLFSSAWENIFIPGLGGFSIGSLAGEKYFFFFFSCQRAQQAWVLCFVCVIRSIVNCWNAD